MGRKVEGVYRTTKEALAAVDRLREEGYSGSEITLVANPEVRSTIPYTVDADVSEEIDSSPVEEDSGQSFWEKLKDAFTMDDEYDSTVYNDPSYDVFGDPLYPHREEIDRGDIVILVEDGEDGIISHLRDTVRDITDGRDDTIELREEHLDVDTREVQTGEIRIGKHIVEESETVDVPVTHEEVTIERRPVTGQRASEDDFDAALIEEEIVIPVSEEQIIVDKDVKVVEEVTIHKEDVTEEKRVSETLRHEELDVDTTGGVHVEERDSR